MPRKIIITAAGLAVAAAGFGGGIAASAVTGVTRPNFVQVTHPGPGGVNVTQAWNCANEGHPSAHFWWFRDCRKAA